MADESGRFLTSLKRNNGEIREDRAEAIGEDARILYKREIEDTQITLKRLVRERDNMLDLSPTDANSLLLASDFNARAFVDKDIELGVKIRNLEIKCDIATQRFDYLFGEAE